MTRPLLLALLLATPFLAGCLGAGDQGDATAAVAASAQEAGAVEGAAPAAAKSPYQVEAGESATVAYPLVMVTNPPKPPFVEEFTGAFQPTDCLPTGGGLPLGGLGFARGRHLFELDEAFAVGDVFSYDISMRFTNTDQSWAELHLFHQLGGASEYWTEPTAQERGEVVMNFTGQGFIGSEDFDAFVGVDCWYGQVTSPVAFAIQVQVTFAEGAVPSSQPVLVSVPDNATRLIVTGLALAPGTPVTSHYRVFAPDDTLVCECALNTNEAADVVELPGPGEYVVLVDHTEGGFVALALDAPSEAPLRALGDRFEAFTLAASDGGPVDEVLQIELAATPLDLFAWVSAPGEMAGPPDAGFGHNVRVAVSNARGDVLRLGLVGYVTFHAAAPGLFMTNDWYAIPIDGEWEFYVDHHAYDLGAHTVTVEAERLRGQTTLFARFYDRG